MSVLVSQLPAGSRIWQISGGQQAWSEELHALMVLDLRLRELYWSQTEDGQNGKNAPTIMEPPPFEDEVEKKAAAIDVKARKFQEMEKRREARRAAAAAAQHNEG